MGVGPVDALKLSNVGYAYSDSTRALENVTLTIKEGERVSLVGPNGAGKSTLLHMMDALYIPTEGELEVAGIKVDKKTAPQATMKAGLLFQDPDDQIFMPRVWDDVAFGPINMMLDEKEVSRRVERSMALAGVSEYAERVPHHLSFGEKKRVAIAGLLAMDPEIYLLDEPTANLDPASRRALVDVLRSLNKSIVLATHDLTVAFELTKRIIVLKKTILYDGDMRGLMARPDILAEANLELPSIPRLMSEWKIRSGLGFEVPTTMDEALEILDRELPRHG
ncbi:MAG: ABC transporter ATP-binding protein [Methanomassiliicoccus sp.]|nr:ABC transporter ATP-binding protein [Methanomassiliicoccus sp.]